MVNFVGAGPGAADLITLRGKRLIEDADVLIYAGSLVSSELTKYAKDECEIYDSSKMTLEEVITIIEKAESLKKNTVRLHTGDPSLYGAIREQIDLLYAKGIDCAVCPGVSSMFAAAAALQTEYTLPGVSQSLIATRLSGRTSVPEREDISLLSAHGASMAVFLSAGMLEKLVEKLLEGGCYSKDTPAALVYKVSHHDEKTVLTTIGGLAEAGYKNNINKTALVLVGNFLEKFPVNKYERSKLYDGKFSHGFRKSKQE